MAEQKIPELWWSPTSCFVYADRDAWAHYMQLRDTTLFELPEDAVRLVCPPAEQTYEWAVRVGDDKLVRVEDRDTADQFMTGYGPTGVLLRRSVGPWEVSA